MQWAEPILLPIHDQSAVCEELYALEHYFTGQIVLMMKKLLSSVTSDLQNISALLWFLLYFKI